MSEREEREGVKATHSSSAAAVSREQQKHPPQKPDKVIFCTPSTLFSDSSDINLQIHTSHVIVLANVLEQGGSGSGVSLHSSACPAGQAGSAQHTDKRGDLLCPRTVGNLACSSAGLGA